MDHALPDWFKGRVARGVYTNPYGLSPDGQRLVDVMVRRGMPIDAAHMSWQAIKDLTAYLAKSGHPDWPVYVSHAHPFQRSAIRREQNVDMALIDVELVGHHPLFGLRPGDDEHTIEGVVDKAATVPSCQGTSVGTRTFVHELAAHPTAITFGTDLNGFINQTRPVGQLRPEAEDDPTAQCAKLVVDIGSEVRTRGLAHIGLLPALYVEMLLAEQDEHGADGDLDGVRGIAGGAAAYVTRWDVAHGSAFAEGPEPDRRVLAATYRGLLFGDGVLKEITVDGAVGVEGPIRLPLLRAIEGTLPYHRSEFAPDEPRVAYPQLPTSIGLALGTQSFGVYPDAYQFPADRCRSAGIVRAAMTPAELKSLDEECDAIEDQASYYKALNYPTRDRRFTKWDREYPGDWRPGLPLPAELPEARLVADWLGERAGRARLIQRHTFANAPVPGLGGFSPAEYLARRVHHRPLRLVMSAARDRATVLAAGGRVAAPKVKASEGLAAYCVLLQDKFPEAVTSEVADTCTALAAAWTGAPL